MFNLADARSLGTKQGWEREKKMDKLSRRQSMALGAIGLSAIALPDSASAAVGNVSGTKLYEHTFLKAKEGLRAQLGLFIAANWFPMDQKGLEQGSFTSYWLLEETGENVAWDYGSRW